MLELLNQLDGFDSKGDVKVIGFNEVERIPDLVLGVLCHTARKKRDFSL